MTAEKEDLLQRFLRFARILIPLAGILLVILQWWQNSQLLTGAIAANSAMREIWTKHPAEFPLETIAEALYVPVAVSPLGAFDPGEGQWLAQSIWMQLTKIARGQDQLGYDHFAAGRQIGMSGAAFAQWMIPILALLLGWRQIHRSRTANLQSWTSLQTQLIEYAGPTVAICCLLTALLERQSLGIEGAVRLMLVLGCYVLYCLAAGTICWLVFHLTGSVPRATGLLVLFWIFNVTLARPFTVNVAAAVFPLPTLDDYARRVDFEVQNGYNGVEPRADRQRRFVNEVLNDYKVTEPSKVPVNLSALILQKEERHHREVEWRLRGELNDAFNKQERLEQALSMLLPTVAIQISSSSLSATDFASERQQLRDADVFWDQMVNKVYYDIALTSGPDAVRNPRGEEYWKQFPFFEAKIPSPFWALMSCLMPALGLALCAAAGALTAFRYQTAPAADVEVAG